MRADADLLTDAPGKVTSCQPHLDHVICHSAVAVLGPALAETDEIIAKSIACGPLSPPALG